MDKVRLGRTDLMVTSVCFGTSGLGDMPDTYGYGVDEARARATLHAIFDGPANFIDTSRNYGLGRSEERIGAAIRERGGLPQGFVISTKLDRDFETSMFDAVARPPLARAKPEDAGDRPRSTSCTCTIPSTRARSTRRPAKTARSANSSASRKRGWRRPWGSRQARLP